MTHEGDDSKDRAHVFLDDDGESAVFRDNHLVMIDTDAKFLDRERFDEWFKAMDDKHVERVE